jgi:hypothetical protein
MLTVEDAENIAAKLGCRREEKRGHPRVHVVLEGVIVGSYGWTRRSKKKEDNNTPYIARQIHLTSREAKDLADCPLTVDEYAEILRRKGILP